MRTKRVRPLVVFAGAIKPRLLSLLLLFALLLAVARLLPAPAAVGQDQAPSRIFLPLAQNAEPATPTPTPTLMPTVTPTPTPTASPTVTPVSSITPQPPAAQDRATALNLYRILYLPHRTTAHGWTGDHAACQPGALSAGFTDSLLKLVNYYRTVAGLPAVVFNPTLSARAQAAALMMSANENLSHNPPSDWACYTQDGALAASRSNLSLFGWVGISDETGLHDAGINGQMEDQGDYNTSVGHRRWILYPYQTEMGVGHVPPPQRQGQMAYGGGALYVLADNVWSGQAPRQSPRDGFIAWPPRGYIPWQALYHDSANYYEYYGDEVRLRWSFLLNEADFGAATITVTHNGAAVAVSRLPDVVEYDENAAVFVPAIDHATLADGADHTLQVTVANVQVGGQAQTFSYEVIIFDGGE